VNVPGHQLGRQVATKEVIESASEAPMRVRSQFFLAHSEKSISLSVP
jgi:hypothetical protein